MRTAVIVGAGIGGLAAATALLRQGWSVRVLEQAPEIAAVGSGIALWPNALHALGALGVLSKLDQPELGSIGGIRDWRGRSVIAPDRNASARNDSSAVVHRADLLAALGESVPPGSVTLGARVRAVRVRGGLAAVRYDSSAGSDDEIEADLVVVADGVHSAVRESLWPDAPRPRYAGQTVWRMVLPVPQALRGVTGQHWSETWGPGSAFGFFPMSRQRIYCYGSATVPAGGESPDGELAELRRRFAGWCAPIPAVLDALAPDQVLRSDVYYLPELPSFVHGPVALLGDSAHAMTPNRGQGGCMALEDAVTLGLALDAEPSVTEALRSYDAQRRPRTRWMARQSRTAGTVAHLGPAPVRALRNALLRMMPKKVFTDSLATPFDWAAESLRQ